MVRFRISSPYTCGIINYCTVTMLSLLFCLCFFSGVLSCTTSSFDSAYDAYPDCAASCLACRDDTYYTNFANNCNYSSGECCTSQYHNSIAQTWSCVSINCGDERSKEAFDIFAAFCKKMDTPLEEPDVPLGYKLPDLNEEEGMFSPSFLLFPSNLNYRYSQKEEAIPRNMADHRHLDRIRNLHRYHNRCNHQMSALSKKESIACPVRDKSDHATASS